MKSAAEKKQSTIFPIAWCLIVSLMLGTCSYRHVSPTAREGRSIFEHLAAQEIRSIAIEPAEYSSMVSRPVVIRDPRTIAAFAKALTNMPTHLPNHPKVTRAVVLRIQLRDKVIGGELFETSNNGITFYYMSDVNTGWVFASYRVPRSRGIFEIIEQALSQQSAL